MNIKIKIIKNYRLLIILLSSLILSLPAMEPDLYAQVYPREYLEEAIENNPGLRAQDKAYEATLEKVDIEGSLPDPVLSGGIFTPPMERFMGKQLFDVEVMQMFPWFGTLEEQRSVARKNADANFQQYRNARNELFIKMTRLWLNIYKKDQQIQIVLQFIEILKAREDIIYSRYGGGQEQEGLMLDLYRLEIQLNELENRKEKLEEEKEALVKNFNILLQHDQDAHITTPDTLAGITHNIDTEEPDNEDFEENPLVNRAQAEAEAATHKKEVARLMTRPRIGFGVQYSHFATGEAAMEQMDGGGMVMPMFSITIPIYGNKNKATRNESILQAEKAIYQKENQINNLLSIEADLRSKHENLLRDKQFYIRQLEINDKAWELVISAYAGGQEGFDELLRIQDQLLESQWRLLETIVEQHINAAEIDKLKAQEIFN